MSVTVSFWTVFEKPPVQAVSAYQRYQNSFIVPGTSGTCSVYIGIRIGSGNGTAWVDNVQLEEGPVANRYNMLINGDFTFNSGAHPTGWSKNSSNDASDIVYTTCTGTKPEGLQRNRQHYQHQRWQQDHLLCVRSAWPADPRQ